jgi:WD40 repeat protein
LTVAQIVAFSLKGEISQLEPIFFGLTLLSVTAFLLIAWKWGNRRPALLGVFVLLYLMFFNVTEIGALSLPSESIPGWLNVLGALAFLALPGFTIPDAIQGSEDSKPTAWYSIFGKLIFILFLFASLLYTFRWLWIWDGMDDGIRIYFMMMVSVIAVISGTLTIILTVSGGRRWAGLIFAMAVIGSIYFAILTGFGFGEENTIYTVTEERALRIQESIEEYRVKHGSYPMKLDDLVPGEMWRIPAPRIMPDQNWCYEAGADYYRLGAVYREHWSSPYREVRVYASAGDVPDGTWECDEKLAEAIAQSGFYGPPPTPVPLPTSVASVPKVIVEPVLQAETLSMGSWSLDGAYLVFGLTEYSMTDGVEQVMIDLRFLDVKTGEVCQPSQSQWRQSSGLYEHSAWLPDGRLLYLTDAGEVLAFTPCVPDAEDLTSRIPVRLTQVAAVDKSSGHILVMNEEAYWLMDGISLELRKIEGIPTESYRPAYAWSPDGERLALSLMSGPEAEDEAFVYVLDWASAQVEHVIPLAGASDAYLPRVDWLTRDELLIHYKTVTIMDFRSEPPATTDVLKEIFLLDIAFPFDAWGMDTVSLKDGTGYVIGVQVNHPRNTGSYIYSSVTGQVEVFQSDVSGLIFLPDGQWMRLLRWEDPPTTRDEYELVWLDGSQEPIRLTVEGHTPRAHFQIFPGYLPVTFQLVFSSSQGISLVSLPDGKTVGFWDISSDADYFGVMASPNGEALIVESGGDGLYYIPVLPGK